MGRKGSEGPGLAQDRLLGCIWNQPWWDDFLRRGQGADRFVTLQALHGSLNTLVFDRLSLVPWPESTIREISSSIMRGALKVLGADRWIGDKSVTNCGASVNLSGEFWFLTRTEKVYPILLVYQYWDHGSPVGQRIGLMGKGYTCLLACSGFLATGCPGWLGMPSPWWQETVHAISRCRQARCPGTSLTFQLCTADNDDKWCLCNDTVTSQPLFEGRC